MLQFDDGPDVSAHEPNVDLGLDRPIRTPPAEDDSIGWRADLHYSDLKLVAVNEALVESPACRRLQKIS